MSFLTRAYGATKLVLKAKAPTIMVVTGVVSMGGAAVIGAKQTLKAEEVIAKHTPGLEKIDQARKLNVAGYQDDQAQTDRFKVYSAVVVDLGKLYAVPGLLFVGGAGLVFGGHHMMVKRNAQMALAFGALKKAFDTYRQRATESMGPDFDQAMMNGWKMEEERDPHTGEVISERPVRDWDASREDPYNRVFAQDTTSEWEDNLGVNRMFIIQQVKSAQRVLNLRGYFYLNELYEALGFPQTDIGQVCGWKVERLPDGTKSIPCIDVGIDKPMPEGWVYNDRNELFLDINCQGLIVGGTIQKALEKA